MADPAGAGRRRVGKRTLLFGTGADIPLMTTVLVLGASRWQIPLLEAARRLGLDVAVTDRDPAAPGAQLADHFAPIDLADIPGTIAWAQDLGIAAVATDQTDLAVPTQAAVAEALGLRGPSTTTALRATHKRHMREAAAAAGILQPAWVPVEEPLWLPVRWVDSHGPLVIVKPADSMGSRGVTVVDDPSKIDAAISTALAFSRSNEVLIEEMLEGTEVTIEGFVDDAGPQILAISSKQHSPPPHRTAWHLDFPALLPAETHDAIRTTAIRTAQALGITSGLLHGEFMVTGRGIYLIEFANRGGGSGTSSHIVPALTGVNVLDLCWRQLLGESVQAAPAHSQTVLLRFLCYPPGTVTAIHGLEALQHSPGVVFGDLYLAAGQTLAPVTNDVQRHGCVIVEGVDHADALRRLDAALECLTVEVDNQPVRDLYRQVYEPRIGAAA